MSRFAITALLLLGIVGCGSAHAQYPAKPVQWIVPFAPGGGTDIQARIVAAALNKRMGQQIIINNRPGAGGRIGMEAMVRSAPDGYTLMFAPQSTVTIAPYVGQKPAYDVEREVVPLAQVVHQEVLFVVPANSPAKTFAEFLALAKKNPGKLNYASAGVGTEMHLTGELLKLESGTDMTHVAFKGGGPAITELVAGRVDMMVVVVSSILPYLKDGRVRALATTSTKRLKVLPDVPTTAEAGLGKVVLVPWWGLFMPAGTPAEVVRVWEDALKSLDKDEELKRKLEELGSELDVVAQKPFTELVARERKQWGSIINRAGVKFE